MNADQLLPYAEAMAKALPFPGVKPAHIASLMANGLPVHLLPGEVICELDEPGALCFFLIRGSIQVEQPDHTGRLRELAVVTAPGLVGHMSIIEGTVAAARCSAVDKAIAMVFRRELFQRLRGENSRDGSTLRRLLLSSLSHHLTESNQRLIDLITEASDAAGGADKHVRTGPDLTAYDLERMAGFVDGWNDGRAADEATRVRLVVDDASVRKNWSR